MTRLFRLRQLKTDVLLAVARYRYRVACDKWNRSHPHARIEADA